MAAVTSMSRRAFRWLRSRGLVNASASVMGRAVFRLLGRDPGFLMDHFPRLGPVTARLPNGTFLRLEGIPAESISNAVYYRGWSGPEPEVAPEFWTQARAARIVIDVGAHVGYYSLLAGLANPSVRVEAFEPLPAVARQLERHVQLNRLGGVHIHRVAVGDREGQAKFFFTDAIPIPSSSGLSQEFHARTEGIRTMSVKVKRLDDVIPDMYYSQVDLLKVDTEATEPEVLRGAATILEVGRPTIFCEILPGAGTAGELEELLRPLGYTFSLLTAGGKRPADRLRPHERWRNWVMERPGVRS